MSTTETPKPIFDIYTEVCPALTYVDEETGQELSGVHNLKLWAIGPNLLIDMERFPGTEILQCKTCGKSASWATGEEIK